MSQNRVRAGRSTFGVALASSWGEGDSGAVIPQSSRRCHLLSAVTVHPLGHRCRNTLAHIRTLSTWPLLYYLCTATNTTMCTRDFNVRNGRDHHGKHVLIDNGAVESRSPATWLPRIRDDKLSCSHQGVSECCSLVQKRSVAVDSR